jgi:glycosidase
MAFRLLFVVSCLFGLIGLAAAQTAPITPVAAAEVKKYLQVPSPDWRDQILYFAMTDRFNDGDPSNSDQKAGEFDPASNAKYSGGDLAGLTAKLDYIKGMGMTSVWITPPVANQWWDPLVNYGGYHGYWGENFRQVDKHLGTLADYQKLSATLHRNGMYLIQDIVPNHTGNFFHMENGQYSGNPGSVPVTKPTQKPFDRNDFTKKADRDAAIYHWTPVISDYNDMTQVPNYQLADLDDLNTENPVVVAALKDTYAGWIKDVGVDAFRIDTLRYVPMAFWTEFHGSKDKAHPGIRTVAQTLGKKDFFTFGEDWETNAPYSDKADRTMAKFLGTAAEPGVGGLLNFPLQADLTDVFGKGRPTDVLSYRLRAQNLAYPDPSLLVNFIDNHDMDRFAAGADATALKQALFFLFTVPGIPVVYYGTEQGFTETRGAMFASGFGSGGRDRFDTDADGYRFLKELSALRHSERELSHGKLRTVKDASTAGILAYTVTWKGRTALVAFNTSTHTVLLDNASTDLPAGTVLERVGALNQRADAETSWVVGPGGLVHGLLAPRSAVVLAATVPEDAVAGPPSDAFAAITGPNNPTFAGNVTVSGTLPDGLLDPRLVVAGNLDAAVPLQPEAGSWSATLPVATLENGATSAVVVARRSDGSAFVSAAYKFKVSLAFTTRVTYDDPAGDDHGPSGTYRYPTNPSFTNQNDVQTVEVATVGSSLRVTATMTGPISTLWNPPNGFDHVAFYLYLQVPGLAGAGTVLPFQNASAPAGFTWNRMAFFEGWNSRLFGPEGAAPRAYGTPVAPAGQVSVDKAARKISFTFGAASLGFPSSLSGTKVYLTTWDYTGLENRNRPLAPEGGDYTYQGPTDGPLIMDDTPVLTLP